MKKIEITMPNFEHWATSILTSKDKLLEIAQALEQSFNQGRSLGYREGLDDEYSNVWWKSIDRDINEQARLNEISENEAKEFSEKVLDSKNNNLVQYKEKSSGCYVAIQRTTGKEIGRKCGGKPFKNIPIIRKD